ncbi:MAG: hypothetical protein GKR90_12705 [Pseudomonadales bacterium]|nr:hypothetical protein [Pseudomonadales bacterium]
MYSETAKTRLCQALFIICVFSLTTVWADNPIPRTPDGKPDFTGTYNAATLTPLERPTRFGDNKFLSPEEAERITTAEQALMSKGNARTTGDRTAPAVGGAPIVGFEDQRAAGESLGAGNVGGYNVFWFDRGSSAFAVDGKFRTSIITNPKNGRRPPMHPEAAAAAQASFANFMRNDGTAWWLEEQGPGPYDDLESRPPEERCLLGFVGGPPTLPSLYNNFVKIVQTESYVMIMNEMIHDARVVRMNAKHISSDVRNWLGDSIGRWDGDTLVIETTNFRAQTGLSGASNTLKVTEHLSFIEDGHINYAFTVDDPSIWTSAWQGDYIWALSDENVYEYACHEGNYALGGIMRGARLLEAEAMANLSSQ